MRKGSLGIYLLTRLLLVLPMLLILLTFVFLLLRVAPGDPIQAALGGRLPADQLEARREAAGYNRPLIVQYGEYMGQVARLDFGTAATNNRPVSEVIRQNGAATLELTFFAIIVAVGVGVGVGLLAGRFRDTWIDAAGRLFGIVIYALPVFFLGILAQLVFDQWLGLLPSNQRASPVIRAEIRPEEVTHLYLVDTLLAGHLDWFWDVVKHLILPATTLGLVIGGVFIRLVRVNVLQTMRGDYVEAARARGIRERDVLVRHAFRNALVPVITVVGLQMALLLSGAVLTEQTFNWPGIGKELVRYLELRDFLAVQGIVTFFALIVVAISVLIDIITAFVDPRVRYS